MHLLMSFERCLVCHIYMKIFQHVVKRIGLPSISVRFFLCTQNEYGNMWLFHMNPCIRFEYGKIRNSKLGTSIY